MVVGGLHAEPVARHPNGNGLPLDGGDRWAGRAFNLCNQRRFGGFREATIRSGTRNLISDVDGLRVGNSEDPKVRTGSTVLVGDEPFTAGVHVLGGAPGTRETELLAPDRLVQQVDAIVLSGGSAFGLDAASGVADALVESGRGFAVGSARVPIVPCAILFDLLNGGAKQWPENPYKRLGRLALAAASGEFELGTAGAGAGATTLDLKGGLGSASAVTEDGFTVGALVAVNSVGSTVIGGGPRFWAEPFRIGDEFGGGTGGGKTDPGWEPEIGIPESSPNANTTIAIVATDAALDQSQATRIATAAHAGLARAIVPSHTVFDGDLVFCAATGRRALPDVGQDLLKLGHAAACCLARAVARGIHAARPEDGDTRPAWRSLHEDS